MDHHSTLGAAHLGHAQNLGFATDTALYAKQNAAERTHAERAQYAVNTARAPLTAELMQALDTLFSVANETHQHLANKHSHLFGHVPSAPGEVATPSNGSAGAPETYEAALSSRLRSLLCVMQDGLAIAQSFGSRL